MTELKDIEARLRGIDVVGLFDNVLEGHLEQIADLNREQLNKGLRADGTSMSDYRNSAANEIYIDDKIERGVYDQSIYPAMNFYDKGGFQKGIKAKLTLFDVEITSSDWKADKLDAMANGEALGITEDSLETVREDILPEFQEKLLNAING